MPLLSPLLSLLCVRLRYVFVSVPARPALLRISHSNRQYVRLQRSSCCVHDPGKLAERQSVMIPAWPQGR